MPFAPRTRKLVLAGLATFATLVGFAAPVNAPVNSAQAAEIAAVSNCDTPASRFSMAVLPDTQFYSRYAAPETGNQYMARYGSEPFAAQTQWIVDNAAKYDLRFTMHLGDIVDQVNHPEQWQVADAAMAKLEQAGQPYSILAGNHDVAASFTPYSTYLNTFPTSRAAKQATFGGRSTSEAHEWHLLNVDGQNFLILNLSWGAQADAITWAKSVLDAHPGIPTILNSHQLINVAGDGVTPIPTDFGETIWKELIAPYDQVFLTFNGHHHGATQWTRTNNAGHEVHQILTDYQMAYMGGNGFMELVEFDLTNGSISQTTFSPWVPQKPVSTLVPDDQAILTGANQTFTIPFDFKARFPGLVTGTPSGTCASGALRTALAAFQAPAPTQLFAPTSASDYPQVSGTRAHWVMPTGQNAVAPVGSTIQDIAGGNTFTRTALNQGTVTGASEGDVTWSTDHHPFSANAGSVCFANAKKSTNTASYFETAANAALNGETFPNGYTIETFVKFSNDFTVAENAWMEWLSRDGQRQNLPGYNSGDPEEPPMAFAVSSLKEIQFALTDTQNPPNDPAAWSGEIVNMDQWRHVVVTNDPATKMATMYIDGVPVLRNSNKVLGLAADGMLPWVLGAGSYAGERQSGFLGCVGETRIVDHVLTADEWLTARAAAVPTPTSTPVTPSTPVTVDTPSATSSAEAAAASTPAASEGNLAGTGQALGNFALVALAVSIAAVIFGGALLRRRTAGDVE